MPGWKPDDDDPTGLKKLRDQSLNLDFEPLPGPGGGGPGDKFVCSHAGCTTVHYRAFVGDLVPTCPEHKCVLTRAP